MKFEVDKLNRKRQFQSMEAQYTTAPQELVFKISLKASWVVWMY